MISNIGPTLAQCTATDTSVSNIGPIYRMLAGVKRLHIYKLSKALKMRNASAATSTVLAVKFLLRRAYNIQMASGSGHLPLV